MNGVKANTLLTKTVKPREKDRQRAVVALHWAKTLTLIHSAQHNDLREEGECKP